MSRINKTCNECHSAGFMQRPDGPGPALSLFLFVRICILAITAAVCAGCGRPSTRDAGPAVRSQLRQAMRQRHTMPKAAKRPARARSHPEDVWFPEPLKVANEQTALATPGPGFRLQRYDHATRRRLRPHPHRCHRHKRRPARRRRLGHADHGRGRSGGDEGDPPEDEGIADLGDEVQRGLQEGHPAVHVGPGGSGGDRRPGSRWRCRGSPTPSTSAIWRSKFRRKPTAWGTNRSPRRRWPGKNWMPSWTATSRPNCPESPERSR